MKAKFNQQHKKPTTNGYLYMLTLLPLVFAFLVQTLAIECYAEWTGKLAHSRYVDLKGYFTIIPPEGWRLQEYPQDPRGKVAFICDDPNVDLRIIARAVAFSSMEEMIASFKDTERNTGIKTNIERITFLGLPAVKRNFSLRGFRILYIDLLVGKVKHNLAYTAMASKYQKYLPIAMASLETYVPVSHDVSNMDVVNQRVANRMRLAQLMIQQREFALAMDYVKEGLRLSPNNQELLKLKKQLEERPQDNVGALKKTAKAYINEGNYDGAIEELTKAISLSPGDAESYTLRGFAYRKETKLDRAIADFNQAVELNDKAVDAYMSRGHCYIDKRQYEKAIADFSKSIQLNPDLSEAYTNRGLALRKSGETKKALLDYDKAIDLDPRNGEAYNNRGVAHILLNGVEKAIVDFRNSCDLGNAGGCRNLKRAMQLRR